MVELIDVPAETEEIESRKLNKSQTRRPARSYRTSLDPIEESKNPMKLIHAVALRELQRIADSCRLNSITDKQLERLDILSKLILRHKEARDKDKKAEWNNLKAMSTEEIEKVAKK